MPLKDKLTIRLGPLAKPLGKRCDQTGETPSELVRRLIADELGVDPPYMPQGFASMTPERRSELARRAREPLAGVEDEN